MDEAHDVEIVSTREVSPAYVSETRLEFGTDFVAKCTPIERLGLHMARITYPESGQVSVQSEALKMEFGYEPIPSPAVPKEITDKFLGHQPNWSREKWKRLNSFSLTNEKSQASVDLLQYLPANYKVFYMPDSVDVARVIEGDNLNIIQIRGDFSQLRVIIALLHELGHVINTANQDELHGQQLKKTYSDFFDYRIKMSPEEIGLVLNEEQSAWSFVAKLLEPFLDPPAHSYLTKEGIIAQRDHARKTYDKMVAVKNGKPYELGG